MDFTRIESELYRLVDQFNERKITPRTTISFLIKYIHLQMEMAEHTKFYSKTRFKILMKSIKILVLWIICSFQPDLIAKELIRFFQIHIQNVYLIFYFIIFFKIMLHFI